MAILGGLESPLPHTLLGWSEVDKVESKTLVGLNTDIEVILKSVPKVVGSVGA
jgi:hypothetical protein